jgi:hypothetical protein
MVSIKYKNKEKIKTVTRTTIVVPYTSFREGHTTFFISAFISDKNFFIFANNTSPLMFHKKRNLRLGKIHFLSINPMFPAFFSAKYLLKKNGRPGGIRTPTIRIWSPAL